MIVLKANMKMASIAMAHSIMQMETNIKENLRIKNAMAREFFITQMEEDMKDNL